MIVKHTEASRERIIPLNRILSKNRLNRITQADAESGVNNSLNRLFRT